jgi:hypothetical protein
MNVRKVLLPRIEIGRNAPGSVLVDPQKALIKKQEIKEIEGYKS